MIVKKISIIVFFIGFFSCHDKPVVFSEHTMKLLEQSKSIQQRAKVVEDNMQERQEMFDTFVERADLSAVIQDDEFIDVMELSNHFILDIKYATSDNFLNEAVYPCAKCYVRGNVAKALIAANKSFVKQGYRIKLFDCYRPYSVQKKMWEIAPNPGYVANPKEGSKHNRGAALDITLTDLDGKELDMGTAYDHFGKEAHHSYRQLPIKVKGNRNLLRKVMEGYGFESIATEWWHYNFISETKFKISDFRWECD